MTKLLPPYNPPKKKKLPIIVILSFLVVTLIAGIFIGRSTVDQASPEAVSFIADRDNCIISDGKVICI